ncbi:hypothetical protein [Nonomuraea sp. NPDC049141]|uniref:hypothetical protein n=1 Tax=Nonomuraea sp. NPDC049141 TaxID=3155500 RepID=UPI0033CB926E
MRRLWSIVATLSTALSAAACTDRPAPSVEVAQTSSCSSGNVCYAAVGKDPAIVVYRGEFYSTLMPLTARLEWVEGDSCLVVKRNGNTENLFSTEYSRLRIACLLYQPEGKVTAWQELESNASSTAR